jgi:predicted polyphosphate/ATP-dependent NAD kinase
MGDHLEGIPEKVPVRRLGLIVNPIAGIGGRVGLKGSDGAAIQQRAIALGAEPMAQNRAEQALQRVARIKNDLELFTPPGEMGADAALACGFEPTVIGSINPGATTARDTQEAAAEMARRRVNLLLFAGGDGTARDILSAVGERVAVLGVPAGVKVYSGVFGATPWSAGEMAAAYLMGRITRLRTMEVMDIDEEEFRRGVVAPRLAGYLVIPFRRGLVQSAKSASPAAELPSMRAIAEDVVGRMQAEKVYILGPGTTTRAIAQRMGLQKTLIGVDVVADGEMLLADASEKQLLDLLSSGRTACIIVTPIGGQGYLFGRGNQQISHRVLECVGVEQVIVVSTLGKINALRGRPLWVDTGSREMDQELKGYIKVIIGHRQEIVYRVAC